MRLMPRFALQGFGAGHRYFIVNQVELKNTKVDMNDKHDPESCAIYDSRDVVPLVEPVHAQQSDCL